MDILCKILVTFRSFFPRGEMNFGGIVGGILMSIIFAWILFLFFGIFFAWMMALGGNF